MLVRYLLIVVLIGSPITLAPASAQGAQIVRKCIELVWHYVGKPLTAGAAERAGGLAAEYFYEKIKRSGNATVTKDDIQALQQRGLSECEIRERLDAMYRTGGDAPRGYSAQAMCSMTGAFGIARGMPSRQTAAEQAVYECTRRGGVPDCCWQGVRVAP